MPQRGLRPVLGLLFLVALPSVAVAQTDVNAEARVYFEEGNRHFERAERLRGARRTHELEEALSAYVESIRIVRSRNAIFNAAAVLEELGRLDEAFTYFTEYASIPGLAEDEVAEGQRRRDALRPRVAVVAVESEPAGAEVRVDRLDLAAVGTAPLEIALTPGPHRIFLSLPNHENAIVSVTAATGQTVPAHGTLRAEAVELRIDAPQGAQVRLDGQDARVGVALRIAPGHHTLQLLMGGRVVAERSVDIEPGAEPQTVRLAPGLADQPSRLLVDSNVEATTVRVDGSVVGRGAHIEAEVPPGPHTLVVSADGYLDYQQSITAAAAGRTRVHVTMMPLVPAGETTLGSAPIWSLVGTGLLAGVATGLGIRALKLHGDYNDLADALHPGEDTTLARNKADDVDRMNILTDVFWGLTLAGAITTVVLFVLDRRVYQQPSTATIALSPVEGGVLLGATFQLEAF